MTNENPRDEGPELVDPTRCDAVGWRKQLTRSIQLACNPAPGAFDPLPNDGSERTLLISWRVLHGIVNEYLDGGDQMRELCNCGQHTDPDSNVTLHPNHPENS